MSLVLRPNLKVHLLLVIIPVSIYSCYISKRLTAVDSAAPSSESRDLYRLLSFRTIRWRRVPLRENKSPEN